MRTQLQVPSDLRFLNIVEHWLLGCLTVALEEGNDAHPKFNHLRLVVVEAFSNVVRHAHKEQPDLPILICLEVKGRDIILEIWDHGQGFDLSSYLPPAPDKKQESGYGWMIMNRLMDRVDYQLKVNGGNCLRLEARL